MKYQKSEISKKMLETAIELYLEDKCKFSIVQLAGAAEEVMAGLLKAKDHKVITGREEAKEWLINITKNYGNELTDKEAGDSLNQIRNSTKHHDAKSTIEDLEIASISEHAKSCIGRAIINYRKLHSEPNEIVEKYMTLWLANKI